MTEALEQIKKVYDSLSVLSINQVVYVLGLMHNIDIPVDAEDIQVLTEEGLLVGNNLHEDIKEIIQEVLDSEEPIEVEPLAKKDSKFSEDSLKVYNMLNKAFCKEISDADLAKYTKFAGGDEDAAKVFYTFLSLMPTQSSKNNELWDKTFSTTYTGVTLRRLTTHTAKKFMTLYKKSDAGLLCLALFLFVKDGINAQGKCFIKKIDTFFQEFNSWYEDATESLSKVSTKIMTKEEQTTGRRRI